jgi:hypothetical protein
MRILPVFIVVLIALLTAGDTAHAQNKKERKLIAEAERISGDTFAVLTKTEKGAKVYAVNPPNPATLNAIDEGLKTLFAIAKKNGYKSKTKYSDYTIFIARADRTKDSAGNYSPDFAIRAAQYKGTIFDQGGFIYAAGMVINNDPCAFLMAEHTKEYSRVSNVVRYEGEHLILYHNDRKRYKETADHSKGGGHPILQ